MALYQWSKTAATNAAADPTINWAEGMPPGSVNDSARAMMARTAEFRDDTNGSLTTGGISTAYTVSSNQGFTSLSVMDKQKITVVFNVTSGAAPTLAVDGLAAEPLRLQTGTAPPSGAFIAGTPYTFTYFNSTTEFIQDGAALNIGAGTVVNSQLANMAAWTFKVNNTSGSAAPTDVTIDGLTSKATPLAADEVPIWDTAGAAMKKATLTALAALVLSTSKAPTVQTFTSGSGTYTPTAGVVRIKVRMSAGGGGGGSAGTGGNGTASSFGTWTTNPGSGGPSGVNAAVSGGSGGTNGTGTLIARVNGGPGNSGIGANSITGFSLIGGANPFGGGGPGSGGQGGLQNGAGMIASGSAGEYVEFYMTAAQIGASLSYAVGPGGAAGTAGTVAAAAGLAGVIIVEEFYL